MILKQRTLPPSPGPFLIPTHASRNKFGSSAMVMLDTGTTIPTSRLAVGNNLRVVSIAVAIYEYFLTLPSEYRLYMSTNQRKLGLILFILIRYSSVILMVISNTGFFYNHFSPNSCSHYYYVAPVFKVIQLMVSQAILGVRTYRIYRTYCRCISPRTYCISIRKDWVGWIILSTYVITFQWFSNLLYLIPAMTNGNCVATSSHPQIPVSTWSLYLAAMLFDCFALSISTVCLIKMRVPGASSASRLVNIMLYDGLGYFVALTAVNMMNVFLHRGIKHSIPSSGVSLGYAVTWIMSQRILLHPYKAGIKETSTVLIRGSTLHVMPCGMSESCPGETTDGRVVNRACSSSS
ncbi:hypothetical protein BJV78DRAFT_379360 [Lactifluus subvellereus]|nr:hypothetical protein BJV78DRAFT_379360 [Lactifluus subvellereus]